jgi:transposase-like protein
MGHNDHYTEAYKREAAAKAQASGNLSQTARELGVSTRILRGWVKQYGKPLEVETASAQALAARVRELERQQAVRKGQIAVLKKPSGLSAQPSGTVCHDPGGASGRRIERGDAVQDIRCVGQRLLRLAGTGRLAMLTLKGQEGAAPGW